MKRTGLIRNLAQKIFINLVGTLPPSMANLDRTYVKTSNNKDNLEKQFKKRK